jgi:flagellar secretion chaperone FliS
MSQQAAAANYLRAKVLTATPEQLQLMLYDGAIRFAEQGKIAIQKKNWETTYHSLSRAQKIIAELTGTLKHSLAPEMCGKLASLYTFVYRKLTEANIKHNVESVDEALSVLHHQRETWVQLMDQIGKAKASVAANKLDIPSPNARMESTLNTAA